ncbi:MAG: Na+/H+ antiporter NhaC [Flavobacteriales bacterium]|nr:Na+/H+ antiporter NhaC [Flavobacteriales bacterium]
MSEKRPAPSLLQALLPLLVLIGLLAYNVVVFGDAGLSGPNQLALLFAAAVALVVGIFNGQRYDDLLVHVVQSINVALPAILILLLIGALAGTWMIGGVVPTMIDHGLRLLSPKIFLVAACIVCAIVSVATGSSWTTAATVGIALIGVGKALGFHEGLVAGAVISGAYFGDKISPLSDTTNLAPAVAGTELFPHIRYMMWTTVPSIGIALLLFLGIGLMTDAQGGVDAVQPMLSALEGTFQIGIWCYVPPAVVVLLIWKKVQALPALFIGMLLGAVFAVLFQPQVLTGLVEGASGPAAMYKAVLGAMTGATEVSTGHELVDELLTTKGMGGMLSTIWLIVCAMTFGGAMEGTGLLDRLTRAVLTWAQGTGSLIGTTVASAFFLNVTASDQYLSIVVPGRMFARVYRERGLDPRVLSRSLEDGGTVTSVLVPWNTCGAYQAGVLGVATMSYLPFCFFNLISPLMSMLQGALGYRIAHLPPQPVGSDTETSEARVS